jgi:hypothetical protein
MPVNRHDDDERAVADATGCPRHTRNLPGPLAKNVARPVT